MQTEVSAGLLAAIVAAIRDNELLRFDYRVEVEASSEMPPSATGAAAGQKLIEPYRLVSWLRRWYLVGRDGKTPTWASFRVDWTCGCARTAPSCRPRYLARTTPVSCCVTSRPPGTRCTRGSTVLASAAEVLARINPTVGIVESVDADTCVLVTGADSPETMAVWIGMLGLDFRVAGPPALIEHLKVVSDRYRQAVAQTDHRVHQASRNLSVTGSP